MTTPRLLAATILLTTAAFAVPAVAVDTDLDGVTDAADNAPAHFNPDQLNWDGDLTGDAADLDIDGDGFDNFFDNAPRSANASQMDTDNDGIGDVADSNPTDTNLPVNRQVIASLPAFTYYDATGPNGLVFDLTGSSNPIADYFSISFDLDNNGSFGDATGFGVSTSGDYFFVPHSTLAAFGITGVGVDTVRVQISNNLSSAVATGVVGVPEPTSLSLLALGGPILLRRRRAGQ